MMSALESPSGALTEGASGGNGSMEVQDARKKPRHTVAVSRSSVLDMQMLSTLQQNAVDRITKNKL